MPGNGRSECHAYIFRKEKVDSSHYKQDRDKMLGVILQRMLCKNDFGELRRGAPRKSQSNFFLRQCNHGNAVCLNSSEAGTILKVPYDTIINIEMGLKQGQLLT